MKCGCEMYTRQEVRRGENGSVSDGMLDCKLLLS